MEAWIHNHWTPRDVSRSGFDPFLSHGPLWESERIFFFFFFTLYHYMLICTCVHIYTCNFMEFLELLKTSPKRTWTLHVAYSCCSLVLSLKLSHQGARNEDRLMQTEISARSQRIYNGISVFIITSVFVSPSWYPETWGAESLCQILLGEVGGLGWAFYSSTEGPCCSVPVLRMTIFLPSSDTGSLSFQWCWIYMTICTSLNLIFQADKSPRWIHLFFRNFLFPGTLEPCVLSN